MAIERMFVSLVLFRKNHSNSRSEPSYLRETEYDNVECFVPVCLLSQLQIPS